MLLLVLMVQLMLGRVCAESVEGGSPARLEPFFGGADAVALPEMDRVSASSSDSGASLASSSLGQVLLAEEREELLEEKVVVIADRASADYTACSTTLPPFKHDQRLSRDDGDHSLSEESESMKLNMLMNNIVLSSNNGIDTIIDVEYDLPADLNEFQKYGYSIDCVESTCSGVGR